MTHHKIKFAILLPAFLGLSLSSFEFARKADAQDNPKAAAENAKGPDYEKRLAKWHRKNNQDLMRSDFYIGSYPEARDLAPGEKWYCAESRVPGALGDSMPNAAADVRAFLMSKAFPAYQFVAGPKEKLYGEGQRFTNKGSSVVKDFQRNPRTASLVGEKPGYPGTSELIKNAGEGVLISNFTSITFGTDPKTLKDVTGVSETFSTCYSETKLKAMLGKTYGCSKEKAANVISEFDRLSPKDYTEAGVKATSARIAKLEKRRQEDLATWSAKKDCSPTLEQNLQPDGTADKSTSGDRKSSGALK